MKIKTIIVLLCFALAIIGIITPVNSAVESISSENKIYTVESKEKTVKVKITWNANGGTIEKKKNVVNNVDTGKKIGKLPTTPKRDGFTFKGWYTKKSGGTKITKDTKPTSSVTYTARWENNNKKIVGKWQRTVDNSKKKSLSGSYSGTGDISLETYEFKSNGDYSLSIESSLTGDNVLVEKGKYKVNNEGKGQSIDIIPKNGKKRLGQTLKIGDGSITINGQTFKKVNDKSKYSLVGVWEGTEKQDYSTYTIKYSFNLDGSFEGTNNWFSDGDGFNYRTIVCKGTYKVIRTAVFSNKIRMELINKIIYVEESIEISGKITSKKTERDYYSSGHVSEIVHDPVESPYMDGILLGKDTKGVYAVSSILFDGVKAYKKGFYS